MGLQVSHRTCLVSTRSTTRCHNQNTGWKTRLFNSKRLSDDQTNELPKLPNHWSL